MNNDEITSELKKAMADVEREQAELRHTIAVLKSQLRKQSLKTCLMCGTQFVGISKKQFCSGKCRVKHFRQLEEQREQKREEKGELENG